MAETTQIAKVAEQPIVAVQQPEAAEAKAKRKSPTKKGAKKAEAITVKSKRKTAVARASLKKGSGRIRVNGFDISTVEPIGFRTLMTEAIGVSRTTEDLAKRVDININVIGGGPSAQAQAVRSAIAKGITKFSGVDTVRAEYMHHDRNMLVDDPRRVEPKKFKGPKARARFQKSYR